MNIILLFFDEMFFVQFYFNNNVTQRKFTDKKFAKAVPHRSRRTKLLVILKIVERERTTMDRS